MDIPEFVPTLAELIKANEPQGNQCCWRKQKKSKQNVIRCGNTVRGRDVKERNSLIDCLRVLIPSDAESGTLGPVTPDSLPKIRETLKKVSMWLLCKGQHRSNSRKIVREWCDELDNLEEARDQPALIDIRKELNIDDGKELFCHGKKQRGGERCSKKISAANRQRAHDIIAVVAEARDSSPPTKGNITLLARLLMCPGYHQDQAIGKSEEWFKKIRKLFPPADALPARSSNPDEPSTPPFSRTITVDSETPRSTTSSLFSRASSISTSTPPTSPPTRRRYNTRSTATESPLGSRSTNTTATTVDDELLYVVTPRVTRRTTFERQAGLLTPEPIYPHFRPLSPKTGSAFLTNLHNLITRAFKKTEATPGYLYGFKRNGEDYIKVGYTTKSVEGRIEAWNKKCNQRVTVVLQVYALHAGKVERLVHASLYNQRRREALVNGACNNGRGCHVKHEEWFEVTLEILREVVGLWIRWFECIPYNNQGCLKSEWFDLIYKLRKAQKKPLPDLWRQWIDITQLAKGATDEVKTGVVDEKSMLSFDDKEEKKTTAITAEIKMKPKDMAAANNPDIRREPRDMNRRYKEAIREIKTETPGEMPLPEYPNAQQGLTLHLEDPFVASPVTTVPA
jgi:hypothetical protein